MAIKVSEISLHDLRHELKSESGLAYRKIFVQPTNLEVAGLREHYIPGEKYDGLYLQEIAGAFAVGANEVGDDFLALVFVRSRDQKEDYIKVFLSHLEDQSHHGLGARCPSGEAMVVVLPAEGQIEREIMEMVNEAFTPRFHFLVHRHLPKYGHPIESRSENIDEIVKIFESAKDGDTVFMVDDEAGIRELMENDDEQESDGSASESDRP